MIWGCRKMGLSSRIAVFCGTLFSLYREFVTVQDGASSCPAKPNKKHRRFLWCEIWQKIPLTSKLDTNFSARFPAVRNSYGNFIVSCIGFKFMIMIYRQEGTSWESVRDCAGKAAFFRKCKNSGRDCAGIAKFFQKCKIRVGNCAGIAKSFRKCRNSARACD